MSALSALEIRGSSLSGLQWYRLQIEGVVSEVIFDHLHATAFQYTPLGRTILGSADNVRSISKANLKDYITKHYTGPRMVSYCSLHFHAMPPPMIHFTFLGLP